MAEFTVSEVIDGDTFKVKEGWKWNQRTGGTVRPTGYNTPEENERGYEEAKRRLLNLILNKTVDIKNAKRIDDYGRLVADVYYNGRNLADNFPELINIFPNIEVVTVFGKNIISIEVTEGRDKPYTASGKPFIRVGNVTKQMKRCLLIRAR